MILNAITPDIAWTAPWNVLQQLCHLWRRFGIGIDPQDRLYISGAQLQEAGLALDYDVFHLLIETDFTALLWAKAIDPAAVTPDTLSAPGEQYEISMVFDPQAIAPLIATLLGSQVDFPQLKALRKKIFAPTLCDSAGSDGGPLGDCAIADYSRNSAG